MPMPIQIVVGEHKSLVVTVPDLAKDQLVDLIAGFFSREDAKAKERAMRLLAQSGEIALILTTSGKALSLVTAPGRQTE